MLLAPRVHVCVATVCGRVGVRPMRTATVAGVPHGTAVASQARHTHTHMCMTYHIGVWRSRHRWQRSGDRRARVLRTSRLAMMHPPTPTYVQTD